MGLPRELRTGGWQALQAVQRIQYLPKRQHNAFGQGCDTVKSEFRMNILTVLWKKDGGRGYGARRQKEAHRKLFLF